MASRASFKSDVLRLEIARRGLTQAQLAAMCGVAEETISRAVHGKPASATTTRAIVSALAETPVLVHADLIEAGK
jgi:transcriptional regulator with XRE-family HTH domain